MERIIIKKDPATLRRIDDTIKCAIERERACLDDYMTRRNLIPVDKQPLQSELPINPLEKLKLKRANNSNGNGSHESSKSKSQHVSLPSNVKENFIPLEDGISECKFGDVSIKNLILKNDIRQQGIGVVVRMDLEGRIGLPVWKDEKTNEVSFRYGATQEELSEYLNKYERKIQALKESDHNSYSEPASIGFECLNRENVNKKSLKVQVEIPKDNRSEKEKIESVIEGELRFGNNTRSEDRENREVLLNNMLDVLTAAELSYNEVNVSLNSFSDRFDKVNIIDNVHVSNKNGETVIFSSEYGIKTIKNPQSSINLNQTIKQAGEFLRGSIE